LHAPSPNLQLALLKVQDQQQRVESFLVPFADQRHGFPAQGVMSA
jgi:hypothetical protein